MSEINLSTFPSNRIEALTMLYLQSRDLSGMSVSEVHELYWKTYYEIKKDYAKKRANGFFKELQ